MNGDLITEDNTFLGNSTKYMGVIVQDLARNNLVQIHHFLAKKCWATNTCPEVGKHIWEPRHTIQSLSESPLIRGIQVFLIVHPTLTTRYRRRHKLLFLHLPSSAR